jgi:hypothetical protein
MEDAGQTVAKPMTTQSWKSFYAAETAEYRALFKSINLQPQ